LCQTNRALTDLHLDYNEIGPEGAAALSAALGAADPLGSTPHSVGAEPAASWGQANTTLTNLWLHGNEIGAAAEKSLAAALARNVALQPRKLGAALRCVKAASC
jgi:hypothetical protein